jgi:hypothetical protein
MHIEYYAALLSINVPEEEARKVIRSMEAYVNHRIEQATLPLEVKIDSLDKRIEHYNATNRWVFGLIGLIVTIAALTGPVIMALK